MPFYDPGPHRIVLLASATADVDLLLRQYGHHVLFANGAIDFSTTSSPTVLAVESGLAKYFCCSYKDDPVFRQRHLDREGFRPE